MGGSLKIEMWPVGKCKPYDKNPRKNDDAVSAVAASIKEFGFRQPIVVDTAGVIIAGHTRWKAAQKLGLTEVPAHVAKDMTPEKVRAYRIADNKVSELATWDDDLLKVELLELKDSGIDFADLGFSADELLGMLGGETGQTDPDDVPAVPKVAKSKRGEIYRLGEHRLMCGDSGNADDVSRLMGDDRATCVFTDPPYGVSIGAKNRMLNSFQKAGRNLTDIVDDDISTDELKKVLLPAFTLVRTHMMAEDCTLMMTAPQGGQLGLMMMMMMMMMESGLPIRHVLVWQKSSPTFSMGRLDYDYKHEPILFTWLKKHKRIMGGEHKNSVWEIAKPAASPEHPTMKPVALYVNAYLNHTETGDVVAEPFSGSGTALLAAQQLNRRCRAMEIAPEYVDVAIQRWENFTGKKAEKIVGEAHKNVASPKKPKKGTA
jgi:site-specific DNA-methyltransferase (adenine-specific)